MGETGKGEQSCRQSGSGCEKLNGVFAAGELDSGGDREVTSGSEPKGHSDAMRAGGNEGLAVISRSGDELRERMGAFEVCLGRRG